MTISKSVLMFFMYQILSFFSPFARLSSHSFGSCFSFVPYGSGGAWSQATPPRCVLHTGVASETNLWCKQWMRLNAGPVGVYQIERRLVKITSCFIN